MATESERDDTGAITERNDDASVFAMRVGDCYDDLPEGEAAVVTAVPCADPHDAEVYHVFEWEGDEASFPGTDLIQGFAADGCTDAFGSFVGVEYEESTLDYTVFWPNEGSWSDGDREFVCLVGVPEEKTSGTLKDAKK